jgi:uncharacterized OB-fold protein
MASQWRCRACGDAFRPARTFCPACGSDAIEREPLASRGKLFTWTTIEVGGVSPLGPAPYVLGFVDLDDGPRVLALLDVAPDRADRSLALGKNVVVAPAAGADGTFLLARPEAADA